MYRACWATTRSEVTGNCDGVGEDVTEMVTIVVCVVAGDEQGVSIVRRPVKR